MLTSLHKKLSSNNGFTILELLIAALITSVITTATFSFFIRMQSQSNAQIELSEAQNLARSSLYDINKTLRMAGYKVPSGHDAYTISGDTLTVYMNGTQPVDTIIYSLLEFTDIEYSKITDLPDGDKLYKLMKQTNSDSPQIFADYLTNVIFTQVSPSYVTISLEVQTAKKDDSRDDSDNEYREDVSSGFKTVVLTESVKIRNISS